jgi:hypothetical protein
MGQEALKANVGVVRSRMGAAFVGSHAVLRGRDIHAELGDLSWFAMYLFGITGRRFTDAQLRLMEAIWSYTCYPDARIWNNRVAALAGTARSTGNLALSAALAVTEADIYGQGPCCRAIDFLIRTRKAVEAGGDLGELIRRELVQHRSLGGYGRPIASADERNVPIVDLARSLGLADGPHLKLAFQVETFLLENRYRMHINYAAVTSALSADMGLSPREHYFLIFACFLGGMVPCYMEAAERPEGTLLPLPCDGVAYVGTPKRDWQEG